MVKGCVWHWLAASLEPSPAEPSGPAGGGSSVRLTDARTHACTHVHVCTHKGLQRVPASSHRKGRRGKAATSQPSPGTTRETDRWTDRQPAPRCCPGTAWETDGQMDRQPTTRRDSRTGGQPPPRPRIHLLRRCRLRIVCPQAPPCGKSAPGGAEQKPGPRGSARPEGPPALAVPAPSRPPAPSSASLCLIAHYVPVRLLREINAVEFISTDGGQFSSSHLTDTSCTSLCQCPCAAGNLYGEQVYYAVFILPAPLQIEFISPHLGEFRFSKEKGMKSAGRSRCAITDSGASASSVAAPGSAPTAPAQGAEHLRVPSSAAAAQGTTSAARAEKQWRGHPAPPHSTLGIFSG